MLVFSLRLLFLAVDFIKKLMETLKPLSYKRLLSLSRFSHLIKGFEAVVKAFEGRLVACSKAVLLGTVSGIVIRPILSNELLNALFNLSSTSNGSIV